MALGYKLKQADKDLVEMFIMNHGQMDDAFNKTLKKSNIGFDFKEVDNDVFTITAFMGNKLAKVNFNNSTYTMYDAPGNMSQTLSNFIEKTLKKNKFKEVVSENEIKKVSDFMVNETKYGFVPTLVNKNGYVYFGQGNLGGNFKNDVLTIDIDLENPNPLNYIDYILLDGKKESATADELKISLKNGKSAVLQLSNNQVELAILLFNTFEGLRYKIFGVKYNNDDRQCYEVTDWDMDILTKISSMQYMRLCDSMAEFSNALNKANKSYLCHVGDYDGYLLPFVKGATDGVILKNPDGTSSHYDNDEVTEN